MTLLRSQLRQWQSPACTGAPGLCPFSCPPSAAVSAMPAISRLFTVLKVLSQPFCPSRSQARQGSLSTLQLTLRPRHGKVMQTQSQDQSRVTWLPGQAGLGIRGSDESCPGRAQPSEARLHQQAACMASGSRSEVTDPPSLSPSCVRRATLPRPGAPTTTWPAYLTSHWMKFRV